MSAPEEQEQIERPMTGSTDAYEYYLRARDLLYRYIRSPSRKRPPS